MTWQRQEQRVTIRPHLDHWGSSSGKLSMTPLGFFGHNVRDGSSSLSRFPLSKLKLDNFFLLWLAAPDAQKLVRMHAFYAAGK